MTVREIQPDDPLYPAMLRRFPSTARYIADPKDHGEYHIFAAVDPEHGVVGGAVIDVGAMGFGPLAAMTVGFLENIEVNEAFRRRGIGTRLLRAALDYAWGRGARNVRWTVDWANTAGVAFYASCGVAIIPEGDSPDRPETCYTLVAVNPYRLTEGYGRAAGEPPPA